MQNNNTPKLTTRCNPRGWEAVNMAAISGIWWNPEKGPAPFLSSFRFVCRRWVLLEHPFLISEMLSDPGKYNGFQNDAVVHALVDFDPLFHKNQGHKFYSRLWRTTDIDGISERTMEQDPLQASSYCFVDCVFVL